MWLGTVGQPDQVLSMSTSSLTSGIQSGALEISRHTKKLLQDAEWRTARRRTFEGRLHKRSYPRSIEAWTPDGMAKTVATATAPAPHPPLESLASILPSNTLAGTNTRNTKGKRGEERRAKTRGQTIRALLYNGVWSSSIRQITGFFWRNSEGSPRVVGGACTTNAVEVNVILLRVRPGVQNRLGAQYDLPWPPNLLPMIET